jgi:hypothetical protein
MKRVTGGRVEILTFKEGLLSKVAHDLLLSLERFEARTDGRRVEVDLDLRSLRVVGVMKKGVLEPGGVSEADKREIERNIARDVLRTDRHPSATFRGVAEPGSGGQCVTGTLTLTGTSRPVAFVVREEAGTWRAEVELVPSEFGIRPFQALMGAIKLRDRVVVRFELPVIPL